MIAPAPSLYLIDATFELFRGYYALPEELAADGQPVGAVRGLIGTTLSLLQRHGVTHVAAATDHIIESFRNQLFDGYKTGEGLPADLLAQFPIAEAALSALGIVVWPMVEFEADDALATAAARFAADIDVVICSPDKDLCQSVRGDRVTTYDRLRDKRYNEVAVRAKFGVGPELIPDLLALVGDTADGIPGIPGWGLKSAAALLAAYGSIDAIPADPRAWTVPVRQRERLAAALAAHADELRLYKRLATLRTDVPLAERLEDLEWRGVPRETYTALCARLGFRDLAERPARWRTVLA